MRVHYGYNFQRQRETYECLENFRIFIAKTHLSGSLKTEKSAEEVMLKPKVKLKVKVKVTLEQAIKSQRGSRRIALLFL
jgi:hypothetical protein